MSQRHDDFAHIRSKAQGLHRGQDRDLSPHFMWPEIRAVHCDAEAEDLGPGQAMGQGERRCRRSRLVIDEFHLAWVQFVNPVALHRVQVVERPYVVRRVAGRPMAQKVGRVVEEMGKASRSRSDGEVRQRAHELLTRTRDQSTDHPERRRGQQDRGPHAGGDGCRDVVRAELAQVAAHRSGVMPFWGLVHRHVPDWKAQEAGVVAQE